MVVEERKKSQILSPKIKDFFKYAHEKISTIFSSVTIFEFPFFLRDFAADPIFFSSDLFP